MWLSSCIQGLECATDGGGNDDREALEAYLFISHPTKKMIDFTVASRRRPKSALRVKQR
jgi:hypothetical protein